MIGHYRQWVNNVVCCKIHIKAQSFLYFSTVKKLNQETYSEEQKFNEKILKSDGGKKGKRFMRSWELHSYGGPSDLQLTTTAKIPIVKKPKDVIVRVYASSINPIDIRMTSGYGSGPINILRYIDSSSLCEGHSILSTLKLATQHSIIEFPLTLGRDFSGVVTEVGNNVNDLSVGDEVFGILGVQRNGSHADFVVTSSDMVRQKPKNLSFLEAASLPYVAMTGWSAIHITGGFHHLYQKKFLVLGGSGGVGTFAIQYLRASGAYVVSTCSPDAFELLGEIGCHFAVDYKDLDYLSHLQKQAPFDCILDLSGSNSRPELFKFLTPMSGQYITLSSPFLTNVDKFGLLGGLVMNINDIALENIKSMSSDKVISKWAFFIPCGRGLDSLTTLAASGKVKPVIQEVFKFEDLPQAYEKLGLGHSRGKIVIDYNLMLKSL